MVRVRPALGAVAVAALLCGPGVALADLIAPTDILSLRVIEWQSLDGTLREWTALNGPYEVHADGTIEVPFVGRIVAAGRATEDLGAQIASSLTELLALPALPAALVEIDRRGPVIVGGMVRLPGEIDFRDGMTARHAVALAGGMAASTPEGALMQRLNAEAQVQILGAEETGLVLKAIRLRAERDGLATADFPDPSKLSTVSAALVEQEQSLLTLRHERIERELVLVDGRRDLLNREISALEEKATVLQAQKALATEQRDATLALNQRGLAVNARLLDAEQTLGSVETQLLDVSTAKLRAGQALAVAETERLELVEGRAVDTVAELQKTETELTDVRARLALQTAVAALSGLNATGASAPGAAGGAIVSILRKTSDGMQRVEVNWDAPLLPGDLVEVTFAPASLPGG